MNTLVCQIRSLLIYECFNELCAGLVDVEAPCQALELNQAGDWSLQLGEAVSRSPWTLLAPRCVSRKLVNSRALLG